MTKLSVIIPVYNQEKLIKRALLSIPCRDDIEVIVIDDCSTDDTLYSVRTVQMNNYYNMVILHNDENMGVGFTINRGFEVASGEYVVLLGSDDFFYTYELSKAMEYLNGTDLVYFNLVVNSGEVWRLNEKTKKGLCGSVKFMRREFVGNIRCPIKRHSEDYDFYQELLKKNPSEVFTDLNVKHYNFPRKNSLYWNATHGEKQ